MADVSGLKLSKQVKNQLVSLSLLILLALALAIALFFYNEERVQQLHDQQLPLWQQQAEFQQHRFAIKQLIAQILSLDNATQYLPLQQKLLVHFQAVAKLESHNENTFKSFIYQYNKQLPEVKRLISNSHRNHKYKQESLSLLQSMLTAVDKLITAKEQRATMLFQQIMADKLTDKVTKTRVKAYAKISQQLYQLTRFHQKLFQVYGKIEPLSLTTPFEEVNELAILVNELFFSVEQQSRDFTSLLSKVELNKWQQLQNILVGDINLIAKWRGQLRLSSIYYQQLKQWQRSIDKPITLQKIAPERRYFFTSIIKGIQQYIPQFSGQYFIYIILVVLALLFIIILLTLLSLEKIVRNYLKQLMGFIGIDKSDQASEQEIALDFHHRIKTLQQHDEAYQQQALQIATLENVLTFIATHSKTCAWQIPSRSFIQQIGLIFQVLAIKPNAEKVTKLSTLWRQAFNKTTRLYLISQAKQAKQQQKIQYCTVSTTQGEVLDIVIAYQEATHSYIGILKNNNERVEQAEKYTQLKNQFSNYQYQIITFNQQQQLQLSQLLDQLEFVLTASSVNKDISGVNVQFLVCQMNELLACQKLVMLFLTNKYQVITPQITERLQLHSTHLEQEILCAVFSLKKYINAHNNQIDLIYHSDILPLVTLDSSLFRQFIIIVSRLLLSDLQDENLQFCLKLQDKNAGQQIINVHCKLFVKQADLLTKLKNLVADNFDLKQATAEVLAVRALFERLGIKEFSVEEYDHALSLQCQLPIALTQDKQSKTTVNFKQQRFVLIGGDEYLNKHLTRLIETNQGFVKLANDCQYFIKNYSQQLLTQQAVAALILLKPNNDDLVNLQQHLQQLPSTIQPKLLVLQDALPTHYNQQGFYDLVSSPLFLEHVVSRLQQLLSSSNTSNQLISSQKCQQVRFKTTQIQVLLATESIDLQMNFSRLLTYLGLQVTLVNNSQTMLEHWQSGKYLILFSEFSVSPFIKFAMHNECVRGVYTFNIELNILNDLAQTFAKDWYIHTIKNPYQLSEITQILSSWLVPEAANNNVISQNNIHSDMVVDTQELDAINLEKYVENQGSIELAALMLSEYVEQIQQDFTQLLTLIKNNQDLCHQSKTLLSSLTSNSKIIAAQTLITLWAELEQAIKTHKRKKQATLLKMINAEIGQLVAYIEHF